MSVIYYVFLLSSDNWNQHKAVHKQNATQAPTPAPYNPWPSYPFTGNATHFYLTILSLDCVIYMMFCLRTIASISPDTQAGRPCSHCSARLCWPSRRIPGRWTICPRKLRNQESQWRGKRRHESCLQGTVISFYVYVFESLILLISLAINVCICYFVVGTRNSRRSCKRCRRRSHNWWNR